MGRTPVLELHGLFSAPWFFNPWRPTLEAHGFEPVIHHYKGSVEGRFPETASEVTLEHFVEGVVEEIDRREGNVVLLGHSMGALVAYMAAQYARPRAIVMLMPALPHPYSMAPFWKDPISFTRVAYYVHLFTAWSRLRLTGVGPLVAPYRGRDSVAFTEVSPGAREFWQAKLVPMPPRVCLALACGVRTPIVSDHGVPILAICGARDPIIPLSSAQRFVVDIGAHYHRLEEAGHMPTIEKAAGVKCLHAVTDWLSEHVSQTNSKVA